MEKYYVVKVLRGYLRETWGGDVIYLQNHYNADKAFTVKEAKDLLDYYKDFLEQSIEGISEAKIIRVEVTYTIEEVKE